MFIFEDPVLATPDVFMRRWPEKTRRATVVSIVIAPAYHETSKAIKFCRLCLREPIRMIEGHFDITTLRLE
jgi:hypothetical protein